MSDFDIVTARTRVDVTTSARGDLATARYTELTGRTF